MSHKHASHRHHVSSIEALALVNVSDHERQVLEVVAAKFQPTTDREIAAALGWHVTSSRPRVSQLVTKGLLIERGRVEEEGSRVRVRVCSISSRGMAALERMRAGAAK